MSTCCLFLLLTVGLLSGCDALTKFCCPPLVVMPSLNLVVLLYSYNYYYSYTPATYYLLLYLQLLFSGYSSMLRAALRGRFEMAEGLSTGQG